MAEMKKEHPLCNYSGAIALPLKVLLAILVRYTMNIRVAVDLSEYIYGRNRFAVSEHTTFGGIMKKAELVAKIAENAGLTAVQAQKALNSFIAVTTSALKAGDKVSLIGFGTFSAAKRAARLGRNPKTGKEIKIAAKTHGKFTPGKALKDLKAAPAKAEPKAKTAPKAKAAAKKK